MGVTGFRVICWGYIGNMEKNMETILCYNRVYIGVIEG